MQLSSNIIRLELANENRPRNIFAGRFSINRLPDLLFGVDKSAY